jgi:hypothetical protein
MFHVTQGLALVGLITSMATAQVDPAVAQAQLQTAETKTSEQLQAENAKLRRQLSQLKRELAAERAKVRKLEAQLKSEDLKPEPKPDEKTVTTYRHMLEAIPVELRPTKTWTPADATALGVWLGQRFDRVELEGPVFVIRQPVDDQVRIGLKATATRIAGQRYTISVNGTIAGPYEVAAPKTLTARIEKVNVRWSSGVATISLRVKP